MTNGEYIARIVEQDEDFCILTDDVAGTVTIEVSLDWWNQPKTEVLDKIRAEIENDWQLKKYPSSPFSCGLRRAMEIIDKYKAESEE